MSTNLQDLFNPGGFSLPSAQVPHNADEYKVSFKEGKGGVYTSVIRFIPYAANPSKSLISKQLSYVKNPITNQAVYVDDPRSIGQKSPIVDMFFACWNSGSEQFKAFAKEHISTKQQYVSLVQIIQDEQHPELVGKIKVFKFGKKIYDKLEAEMQGIMGNGMNPFHPITGRYFMIKCISQSGFNNFDQSTFFDYKRADGTPAPSGFYYAPDPNNPAALTPVTAESDQQVVADYLMANSPDLSKYDYTPWSAQDDKFINDTLAIIANYLEKGTIQTNLQAVNTVNSGSGALKVNTAPSFPGAQVQPQVAPVQPQFNQSIQPQVTPAQQTTGLQFGMQTLGGMQTPQSIQGQTPSISGIDLPNLGTPSTPTPAPGIGGNLDDIIAQL